MSVIAGLQDFRQEGPPADIGTFQLPCSVLVLQHTFSGTTYIVAIRSGDRGWVLVDLDADASTVIQSGVDSVPAIGGTICLLNDIFTLTANIVMWIRTDINFYGGGTVITQANGADIAHLFYFHDCVEGGVYNMRFDGNGDNQTGGSSIIHIGGTTERLCVDNVSISNAYNFCVYISGTANQNWVVDSYFTDSDNAAIAIVYSSQITGSNTIARNHIYHTNSFGIALILADGNLIIDNTIRQDPADTNNEPINLDRSSNNLIMGNKGYTSGDVGLSIHTGGTTTLSFGNQIIGNEFYANQFDGIHILQYSQNNQIIDNFCWNNNQANDQINDHSGIRVEGANCLSNFIQNNTCIDTQETKTQTYGIYLLDLTANNIVRYNDLQDNLVACIMDYGINTILETKPFPFVAGGDVEGTAVWAKFISASASAKGWQVNGADDWAVALGQLPPEVQQVVRIKIWAVALGAPIGAGGQMHLDILINAGASNLAYTTETIGLVSFDGEEADYVATDVVHWSIDAGDDADINDLTAGMSIECKVIYQAGDDPDGATNAVFRVMKIEYV